MPVCFPLTFPLPFGYNPSVPTVGDDSYIITHFQDGRARLIEQYRDKPRIEDLTGILMGQIQAMESALWQLFVERSIDTGIGAQLDVLGDIVGAERQALNDADFTALIRATIKANNSEGTPPDIFAIVGAALGNPVPGFADLIPRFPAGYHVIVLAPPLFDEAILSRLIQAGTSAGVRAVLIVSALAVGTRFRFTSAALHPVQSPGTGFASASFPAVDGGGFTRALSGS